MKMLIGPKYDWTWKSPAGVSHRVRADGRCTTCGSYHKPADTNYRQGSAS